MINESLLSSTLVSPVSMEERICVSPVLTQSMELSIMDILGLKPLRVCKYCGEMAWEEKDLVKFKPTGNRCKKCFNEVHSARRITYKGRRIYLKENPRTNVCPVCGKTKEENHGNQMSMHHKLYILDMPQAFTVERCISCHGKERGKK